MRVKKFEARSMKEALRMVKAELGPEAVILGARENKRSFGLGGEASFEVTAAVSETTLQKKKFVESRLKEDDREKFRAADARMQRRMIEKMVEKRLQAQVATPQSTTRSSMSQLSAQSVSSADPNWKPRPITKISYIDIPDEAPVYAARRPASQAPTQAPARAAAKAEVQPARANVDGREVEERGKTRARSF
jgi:flagellar biosynthesis protein FlhF